MVGTFASAPASLSGRGRGVSNGRAPTHFGSPPEARNRSNGYHVVLLRNRLTALMVDGDRLCRMVETGLLRHCGFEAQDVDNGQAAVNLIACGATFNLIVVDKNLPVLGGPEATRQIRAMGVRTKMVGMIPCMRDRDRQAFLDAGVDQVIEKPLSPETLLPILLEIDGQN